MPKRKAKTFSKLQPNGANLWQVQAAKARFSELFRLARLEGPQIVTRQGKESVVVVSLEQYHELETLNRQPEGLLEFFAKSPLVGLELDFERSTDTGRTVEL